MSPMGFNVLKLLNNQLIINDVEHISLSIKSPFGLAYFRAYIKQLMQINKFLCIIYKFLRWYMEK